MERLQLLNYILDELHSLFKSNWIDSQREKVRYKANTLQ